MFKQKTKDIKPNSADYLSSSDKKTVAINTVTFYTESF